MNRRSFLRSASFASAGMLALGGYGCGLVPSGAIRKLTILHTNDLHSRIDPFPAGEGRFAGLGGLSRIASIVQKIRKEEQNVLLFDSGDIFQGTPYFNYYGGELEFKLMSKIGYDAVTLGNHDFDNGISGLVKQMPHANFPFINTNYDVRGTQLENRLLPHKVFEKDGIRVGVFGLGIQLEGLVNPNLYGKIRYKDPVLESNTMSKFLKKNLKCNIVVCLSHLGYKYDDQRISDIRLGQATDNIDVIFGGHTHTFLNQPEIVTNNGQGKVLICQVGWAGINIGKLDFLVDDNGSLLSASYNASKVSQSQ